ncbi:MAG TPA: 3-deoxy-7-phosphoheptulonate synthase, partial [Terriglobales bacterium]
MLENATEAEIAHVIARVQELGYKAQITCGEEKTIVAAVGSGRRDELEALSAAPGVERLIPIAHPFKLVARQGRTSRTVVSVGDVRIGGDEIVIIAGPCSVESREQLFETAYAVRDGGATMLRGGAYKPRTSPYEFQGLGINALKLLREASDETGLPVVTEVLGTDDVDLVAEYADMLQIGARNMQNFSLLRRVAKCPKPVMLKRGPSATVKEWMLAAEYLIAGGNPNVVLCERGVKSWDTETRNLFDLASVALARQLSHLPVIADPSHGTGRRDLIPVMSRAAIAAGADGIMVEVHPCPERALSDGPQSLEPGQFADLVRGLFAPTRRLATPTARIASQSYHASAHRAAGD